MSAEDDRDVATMQAVAEGHVSCPSCGTFPGRCCSCRDLMPKKSQKLSQDLVSAARGDGRRHLFCDSCLARMLSDFERLMEDDRHKGINTELAERMS